jgi:protein-S-isoprenylcysteine O-methyltransferase Ste14
MHDGVKNLSPGVAIPTYLVVGGFAAYGCVIGSIILAGLGLSFISRLTLGRAYHFMPRSKALVTHGIYRWFRHPMYIGNQLFFIGAGVLLGSHVGLLLSIVVLIPTHIVRARYEEKVLTDRFGSEYTDYKERTII